MLVVINYQHRFSGAKVINELCGHSDACTRLILLYIIGPYIHKDRER